MPKKENLKKKRMILSKINFSGGEQEERLAPDDEEEETLKIAITMPLEEQ